MNIQNNILNFRYSPQQYGSPLDQQNQMTNYSMLSNNVNNLNNLNLNSPTALSSSPNQFFSSNVQQPYSQQMNQQMNQPAMMPSQMNYQTPNYSNYNNYSTSYSNNYGNYPNSYNANNYNQQQLSPNSQLSNPMGLTNQMGAGSPTNRYSPATFSKSRLSPSSLSPSSMSPTTSPPTVPTGDLSSDTNLKTFNFQNRTHVRGYHNNFEPEDQYLNQSQGQSQFPSQSQGQSQDYKGDYKDEYRDEHRDEYRDDCEEEDRNKNRFLSATRNLPLSNVDCGNNSAAAPRTGSTSPISSYNSPAVVESNRIKKNKFNFRKKFKIKHSPTKQSKKSNKSQKVKNPGLLYSQLNKGINSGTLNSINKMQLSILNTGLIRIESEKATNIIAKEPFDLSTNKFIDHLTLLRKYNVLFKIEYFVSVFWRNLF